MSEITPLQIPTAFPTAPIILRGGNWFYRASPGGICRTSSLRRTFGRAACSRSLVRVCPGGWRA